MNAWDDIRWDREEAAEERLFREWAKATEALWLRYQQAFMLDLRLRYVLGEL